MNNMIFKTEINPRDFKGYFEMIAHLQKECFRLYGVAFNPSKISMGQIYSNGEMCWFEGHVDDEEAENAQKVSVEHFLKESERDGLIPSSLALDVVRADRLGQFDDSPKIDRVTNIHIASLGTFIVRTPIEDSDFKSRLTKAVVDAINDIKL